MIQRGLYQHFKGNFYKVLDVAHHSETQEPLVIYQALYGDKGVWARPVSMFLEPIEHDGRTLQRFAYCTDQSEVLEVAILNVIAGREREFEVAFAVAQKIIAGMGGYISHRLERCVETQNRYILLVEWQTLEDHTQGFRQSEQYHQWRELLHHFYQPFPQVQHFQATRETPQ